MNIVKCSYCNQPCINNETHICKEGVHLPYERSVFHYDFQIPSQEHGNVQGSSSLPSELSNSTVRFSSDVTNVCGEFTGDVSVPQDQSTLCTSLDYMNVRSTQKLPYFQSTFNICENLNRAISLAQSYEGFQISNLNEKPSQIYPQYFSANRDNITLNSFGRTDDCIESTEASNNIQLIEILEKRWDISKHEHIPRNNSFALQQETEIETTNSISVSLSRDKSEKPFHCDFEGSNSILNKHICPDCQNGLGLKSQLNEYSGMFYDCKSFICFICQKEFLYQNPLKNSTLDYTQDDCLAVAGPSHYQPSIIDTSQKNFTEERNLKRHNGTPTKKNSFSDNARATENTSCSVNHDYICPKHLRAIPFLCNICDRAFSLEYNLKQHKFVHEREKPFKCNICGGGFTLKIHLKRHEINHTREKLFNCEVCGKEFPHKSRLKRHSLVHSGVQLFNCDICDRCFSQKYNLKRHKLTHSREKS